MKIKRKELNKIHQDLTSCGNLSGEKFTYMYEKNINKITSAYKEQERFIESIKPQPTEKIAEYQKKSMMLYGQLKEGKIIDLEYKAKQEEFNLEYPEESKLFDDYDLKFIPYMEEEIDIDFHTIKRIHLPEALTGAQRVGISIFIEE